MYRPDSLTIKSSKYDPDWIECSFKVPEWSASVILHHLVDKRFHCTDYDADGHWFYGEFMTARRNFFLSFSDDGQECLLQTDLRFDLDYTITELPEDKQWLDFVEPVRAICSVLGEIQC